MPKDFGVFETIRKVKYGGTMRAIHKDLSPKLIKEYPEPFELVVVEVNVHSKNNNKKITGVGHQENWEEEKQTPFFIALNVEVVKAHIYESLRSFRLIKTAS